MNSLSRKVLFFIPLFIILPFIIISYYNHPALDDWWYAEVYKQYGLLGAQHYWYTNYTARFFSNFVMTIAPLSFGIVEGYKILPVIFILCLYCACRYISNVFFYKKAGDQFILPLWLTATYLLIQRDYFECLYWLSANVVYQYTMLMWMLHVTLIYQVFVQKKCDLTKMVATILLSAAVIGSNETLGGIILAEAVLLLLYSLKQKKLIGFSSALFTVVMLSWLVMLLAVGNWKKIEGATHDHIYTFHFFLATKYSLISVGYYSVFLLKQLSVWCLIILSVPFFRNMVNQKLGLYKKTHLLLLAGLSASIAFAVYFISIYPTGILIPPLRVTNIAIVFLFATVALLIVWLTQHFEAVRNVITLLLRYKHFTATACLLFTIITPTRFQQLLQDLVSGRAKNYNDAMYKRYSTLRNSTGTDTIYLNKLTNVPRTIVATDVSGPVSENMGLIFGRSNKVIIKE